MNTVEEVLNRAELCCYGVNPLAIDRLHKGTEAELKFYRQLIPEYKAMKETLDTAALLIAERDAELADLREAVRASGVLSMGMGEKRDPEKDAE